MKSPARASGSSGHAFATSLPSPILRHVLDVPNVPHHIPKLEASATFASERAAEVDMDLQRRTSRGGVIGSIVVSVEEAMAISRRHKTQFDDVDEKETLKYVNFSDFWNHVRIHF
jgi:hypothetical protein